MVRTLLAVLGVYALFGLAGCNLHRQLIYFQGAVPSRTESEQFKLKIYPGDIVTINVFTTNVEAYPYLAAPADRPVSDTRSAYEKGYVINDRGEIKLPLIGTVLLSGLTLSQASDTIEKKFRDYMEDPIVTIKKLNFKVTVLGEVNRPGTYAILNERATLPEVLGMAGDLSQFGDHKMVRIIRMENNESKDFFVDLTSSKALSGDTYFLHPDDIVYVQPLRRRAFQNISPSVALLGSIVTTLIVSLTFVLTRSK